jgi:hypothetical protein
MWKSECRLKIWPQSRQSAAKPWLTYSLSSQNPACSTTSAPFARRVSTAKDIEPYGMIVARAPLATTL